MTGAPPFDSSPISAEEFAELMAIVRAPPPEPLLSADGQWRREFREGQYRKRVAAVQPDLFGAAAVTHYRRHAARPAFTGPRLEEIGEKLARIATEAQPTFGPVRSDRPAHLDAAAKDAIVRGAANWLQLGQRVRIVDGPCAVDPTCGNYQHIGRTGTVYRLCSPVFADHVYIYLDPVGQERAAKVLFLEIRDLEPLAY